MKICARLCAMNYGTAYTRLFMHYRTELRLTMEIAVQKCLTQHVRMKEEFVFMEKWNVYCQSRNRTGRKNRKYVDQSF